VVQDSPDASGPARGSDFERQKWQAERDLRIAELRRSHWTQLLLVAVVAIALAAFGAAGVALFNAQRTLEARIAAAPVSAAVVQCPPGEARRDLGLQWLDVNCRYRFPPNNGFKGPPVEETLKAGTEVDRYGQPGGSFLAPAAASYAGRALPYDQAKMDYYRYVVVKEFTVKSGAAVPWFDQAGGDIQYMTDRPVRQLIIDGYLKEVGKVERDRQ
jgi:hypothetical protein